MSLNFKKEEILKLLVSALILGFVFGFDDKKPYFDINLWLLNFFLMALLSLFCLVIYTSIRKLAARRFGCGEEFILWNMKRFGFKKTQIIKTGFPMWFIFPFLITLLTEGKVFFSATTRSFLTTIAAKRFGREFKEVTEWEHARISAAPILTAALIALIINLFDKNLIASQLILINLSLAISNVIPLPGLDGFNLFFSSRPLYIFVVTLVALTAILLYLISSIPAILIGSLLAVIATAVFYYYSYIK